MSDIESFLRSLDEHSEIYIQTRYDKGAVETNPYEILNYLISFIKGSNSVFTADDYVIKNNLLENHFVILFRKKENWEMERYFGKAIFQKITL